MPLFLLDLMGFSVSDLEADKFGGFLGMVAFVANVTICTAIGKRHPKLKQWATDTFWGFILFMFGSMFAISSMTFMYILLPFPFWLKATVASCIYLFLGFRLILQES